MLDGIYSFIPLIDQLGQISYIGYDQSGQLNISRKGINDIYSKFFNLTSEKQKQIIDAAIKEFAQSGFKKASTNEIIKTANISKGSLFNYFDSKRGLYLYLIDYAINIIEQKFLNLIDMDKRDLFARLRNIATIKMEFLKNHPNTMYFLSTVFLNDNFIDQEITAKIEKLQSTADKKAYENIDFSLFHEDIDPKKAFQIIRWAFDGYEAEMKIHLKGKDFRKLDLDQYWDEFYEYIDVMKISFYK